MQSLNSFLNYLMMFRSCWFAGYVGSGKTSIAVEMALRLVVAGKVKRIVSNVPLALEPDDEMSVFDVPDVHDAAIIVDEAWNFLMSGMWKDAAKFVSYPRHNNQVILLPSTTPLTTYVRWLRVERVYNGLPMSIPFWLYRCDIGFGESSSRKAKAFRFAWYKPQSIFGWYVHKYDQKKHNPEVCYVYEVESLDTAG